MKLFIPLVLSSVVYGVPLQHGAYKLKRQAAPTVPTVPTATVPGVPVASSAPVVPPAVPSVASVPSIPAVASAPVQPSVPGTGASSGVPPTSSGAAGGGAVKLVGPKTGDATHYDGGPTSCGTTVGATSMAVALNFDMFNAYDASGASINNPNKNPICHAKIKVQYEGRTADLSVQDKCGGCAVNDLDMTDDAFKKLFPNGDGRVHGVTWDFVR